MNDVSDSSTSADPIPLHFVNKQKEYSEKAQILKFQLEFAKHNMETLVFHHDVAPGPGQKWHLKKRLVKRAGQVTDIIRTFNLAVAGLELCRDNYGDRKVNQSVIDQVGRNLEIVDNSLNEVLNDGCYDYESRDEAFPPTKEEFDLYANEHISATNEVKFQQQFMGGGGGDQRTSKEIVEEAEKAVHDKIDMPRVSFVDHARSQVQTKPAAWSPNT
ncbi:hypothetical protein E8E13_007700 [Curvularia kusanoi]|uniref:Uncharacterized protein n=1 Tax=Curvularia kusanoi TaxID=90978 RepID=A0A9P4TAS4_CURKU|nr:hypothetical protein E8E13_007700 [Curvularia kusanoi]